MGGSKFFVFAVPRFNKVTVIMRLIYKCLASNQTRSYCTACCVTGSLAGTIFKLEPFFVFESCKFIVLYSHVITKYNFVPISVTTSGAILSAVNNSQLLTFHHCLLFCMFVFC